jgi:tRNA 2-selenouridine synthase
MQIPEKFNPTVSAAEVLKLLPLESLRLLDVRAPVEFAKGMIPGTRNGPILNNAERHQVGIIYREDGQAAAIALGHQLVEPVWEARVEEWLTFLRSGSTPLLYCWRGGLRSETAQQWLIEAGLPVPRVQGGYQALRRLLCARLAKVPKGVVITGMTGTGKTRFLKSLGLPEVIDLEKLAHHKGSAFGNIGEQPAQQTFENALALELERTGSAVILEDESRLIGSCGIPEPFYSEFSLLPRVVLTAPFETRVENIVDEYILAPADPVNLEGQLEGAILQIKNRLGGADTAEILGDLREAFRTKDLDMHRQWIGTLLSRYYDRAYAYSASKGHQPVLFEGDARTCAAYLRDNPQLLR